MPPIPLKHIVKTLSASLTQAPPGWDAVREHRELLRPGLFVYAGGAIYRHWLQPLPKHIRETKGHRRWLLPTANRRTQIKHLLLTALEYFRIRVFWVRRTSDDGFPIVIAGSLKDCIFIDPPGRKVARQITPEHLTPGQDALHKRWAKHIPSPAFHLARNNHLLIEQYIQGRALRALDDTQQVNPYRKVFHHYTNLARSESSNATSVIRDLILSKRVMSLLHAELQSRLQTPTNLEQFGRWPLTPTFSDSHASNIIVLENGEPVFIDCFPITLKPFFYTPLYIISRSPQLKTLRSAYFSGAFDQELTALFTAAGQTFQPTVEMRDALLATTIVYRALSTEEINTDLVDHIELARRVNWFCRKGGFDKPDAWH